MKCIIVKDCASCQFKEQTKLHMYRCKKTGKDLNFIYPGYISPDCKLSDYYV